MVLWAVFSLWRLLVWLNLRQSLYFHYLHILLSLGDCDYFSAYEPECAHQQNPMLLIERFRIFHKKLIFSKCGEFMHTHLDCSTPPVIRFHHVVHLGLGFILQVQCVPQHLQNVIFFFFSVQHSWFFLIPFFLFSCFWECEGAAQGAFLEVAICRIQLQRWGGFTLSISAYVHIMKNYFFMEHLKSLLMVKRKFLSSGEFLVRLFSFPFSLPMRIFGMPLDKWVCETVYSCGAEGKCLGFWLKRVAYEYFSGYKILC